jgi:hypothetical protein
MGQQTVNLFCNFRLRSLEEPTSIWPCAESVFSRRSMCQLVQESRCSPVQESRSSTLIPMEATKPKMAEKFPTREPCLKLQLLIRKIRSTNFLEKYFLTKGWQLLALFKSIYKFEFGFTTVCAFSKVEQLW